jgi:ADP-heptose:LPS heptosyltransferase
MESILVHPAGGLGDSVLAWPLLRTLAAAGPATAVMADSRARLAARCLGVRAWPDHLPPWPGLWAGRSGERVATDVGLLLVLGDRPAAWLAAAGAAFPAARVEVEGRPLDRRLALELAERWGERWGDRPAIAVEPRANPSGPVLLHVGAGSPAKQWPLPSWWEVAGRLGSEGIPTKVLAGEAEAERWSPQVLTGFTRSGGVVLTTLESLEAELRAARAFAAADTGSSHLAAQLGVPTLTLFGPTDPARWSPIGPRVVTRRSEDSRMETLEPDVVLRDLRGLLR